MGIVPYKIGIFLRRGTKRIVSCGINGGVHIVGEHIMLPLSEQPNHGQPQGLSLLVQMKPEQRDEVNMSINVQSKKTQNLISHIFRFSEV